MKCKQDKKEDIEFMKLNPEQRKVLLIALDIDINNLKCKYCNEELDYKNCGIMSPLKKGELAVIICSSPLCVSEYLNDFEEEEVKTINI